MALQPNCGLWPPPLNFPLHFGARSRTVGRTPWTGDQLVVRSLLTAPDDCLMMEKLVE
jgi:hypothetical protein